MEPFLIDTVRGTKRFPISLLGLSSRFLAGTVGEPRRFLKKFLEEAYFLIDTEGATKGFLAGNVGETRRFLIEFLEGTYFLVDAEGATKCLLSMTKYFLIGTK